MSLFLSDSYLLHHPNFKKQSYQQQSMDEGLAFKQLFLCKKCIIMKKSKKEYESMNHFQFQQRGYVTKIMVCKQSSMISFLLFQIENHRYRRLNSKALEILFIKNLYKIQNDALSNLSSFFVINGCICMKILFHAVFSLGWSFKKMVGTYQKIFIEGFLRFFSITQAFYQDKATVCNRMNIKNQLQEDLYISQSFMPKTGQLLNQEFARYSHNQIQEVKDVVYNIVNQTNLQKQISFLFSNVQRKSSEGKVTLNKFYKNMDRYAGLLLVDLANHVVGNNVEQSIYSRIEIMKLQQTKHCIGIGGLSQIYLATLTFNFINSYDDSRRFMAHYKETNRVVAVKCNKIVKPQMQKKYQSRLNNEKLILSMMKNSHNPFFLRYYYAKTQIYDKILIMEFKESQTLDVYMEKIALSVSLWSKIRILLNIVFGMKHLMDYNIVHLDLKPTNILVYKFLVTKIIDFGQAYQKQISKQGYVPGFTFPYVAPEVFKLCFLKQKNLNISSAMKYTQAQDVYAFGIIMSQVLFNDQIFYLSDESFKKAYLKKQLNNRIFFSAQNLSDYGSSIVMSSLYHIMMKCLQQNPFKRPKLNWITLSLRIILNSFINST